MTTRAVNGKSAIFFLFYFLLLELLYFFVSLGSTWFGGKRCRLGDAAWSLTIRPASSLTLGSWSTIFSFTICGEAGYAERFRQGTGTLYVKCPARCQHPNKIVPDMCTWFFFPLLLFHSGKPVKPFAIIRIPPFYEENRTAEYAAARVPCSLSLLTDTRFPPKSMQAFRASCQAFLSSSTNPKILKHWDRRKKAIGIN